MSISVIKSPKTKILLDDGFPLKLQTDNLYSDLGQHGSIELRFTPDDPYTFNYVNETFQLTVMGVELDFVFKETPDESGYQLTSRPDGMSITDFVDQVAGELMLLYDININFSIRTSHEGGIHLVIIKSKEVGAEYSVNLTANNVSGLSTHDYTIADNAIARDNYALIAQVWKKADPDMLLGTDALSPDINLQVFFDLKEYIKNSLSVDFIWPQVDTELFKVHSSGLLEIFYRYAEKYEGTVFKMSDNRDTPITVLPGGVSWRDKAFYSEFDSSYFQYSENIKKPLTWQPSEKLTSKEASERLYFVLDKTHDVDLKVKITYNDGSDTTQILIDNINSHPKELPQTSYVLYEFLTGYLPNNLETYSAKEILKWEVWLCNNTEDQDWQVQSYILDQQYYFKERHFIFSNSFKCYDTIRATGVFEKESQYDRTLIEVEDYLEYNYTNRQKRHLFIDRTQSYKGNIGFVSKATKDWLEELMMSDDVYELKGDLVFPVVIISKKVFQHTDDETLFDLELEYQRAYTDNHFSNQLPDEDVEYLLDEESEILKDAFGAPLMDS